MGAFPRKASARQFPCGRTRQNRMFLIVQPDIRIPLRPCVGCCASLYAYIRFIHLQFKKVNTISGIC